MGAQRTFKVARVYADSSCSPCSASASTAASCSSTPGSWPGIGVSPG